MKPGKVQQGKDSTQTQTSAAPAPYSLPGMSGGRSISQGKENTMDRKTRELVLEWLKKSNGNVERLAKWMRDSMRLGSIGDCREIIAEAIGVR